MVQYHCNVLSGPITSGRQTEMAVVIDEGGSFEGVLTVENILDIIEPI